MHNLRPSYKTLTESLDGFADELSQTFKEDIATISLTLPESTKRGNTFMRKGNSRSGPFLHRSKPDWRNDLGLPSIECFLGRYEVKIQVECSAWGIGDGPCLLWIPQSVWLCLDPESCELAWRPGPQVPGEKPSQWLLCVEVWWICIASG